MERWDAYTRDGVRTGMLLTRGEPVPDGLYHLVCEALVIHEDGSVLCMKRSMEKPNYPGWYEATAGGSALAGEDALQCVRREVMEETGLCCYGFEEVDRHVSDENHTIFYTYLCRTACAKNDVRLQPGETEGYLWMTAAEFAAFAASDRMIPSQRRRFGRVLARFGVPGRAESDGTEK